MKIDQELEKLIIDFYDEFYFNFSSIATERGIHRYDYKLCNLRNFELEQWKQTLLQFRSNLVELKNKKNLQRSIDFQIFEKMLSPEEGKYDISRESIKSNPIFFINCISEALKSIGFGAYATIGLRSRAFSSRLGDVKNMKLAIEECITNVNSLERDAALSEINFLLNFINFFSSYLINKSDIEKKDDIRLNKEIAIESIKEIERILLSKPEFQDFSLNYAIKAFNFEELYLRDIAKSLNDSLYSIKDSLIKKAREINIISPFSETIRKTISSIDIISEKEIIDIYNQISEASRRRFPDANLQIEFKKVPTELEGASYFINDLYSLKVIPTGEFDTRRKTTIILLEKDNKNLIVLNLIEGGVPGLGLLNEIKAKHNRIPRKYFTNNLFKYGWIIYSRREIFDELKYNFGREFELLFLYKEYLTTLAAYIQNEIIYSRLNIEGLKNLVFNDEIVSDKDQFIKKVFIDEGRSLLGMHGLYNLIDLKRQHGGRMKLSDFHFRVLVNSNLPFNYIRQTL